MGAKRDLNWLMTDPALYFTEIKDGDYSLKLSRKINRPYHFGGYCVDLFKKCKLIKKEKIGRIKYIYLTEKGKKLQQRLQEIKTLINK